MSGENENVRDAMDVRSGNNTHLMNPLGSWIELLFAEKLPVGKVLFRVDAGRVHGLSYGHLSRCLVIAGALGRMFNSESLFLMRDFPDGIAHAAKHGRKVGTVARDIKAEDEGRAVLQAAENFRPDWLVVDLPYRDMDTSYFTEIKEQGTKVLFIDDARFMSPDADVILNSSIMAPGKTSMRDNNNARYLLGPQYFIFDDPGVVEKPLKKDGVLDVLVTFGGSDPSGLTLKAVKALKQGRWNGTMFRIVLGPGHSDSDKVRSLINNDSAFELIMNPPDLIPLLSASDLTICAGGRTMYELVYLKKRFFPVASAGHEAEAIEEFIRGRFIESGMTAWSQQSFIDNVRNMISTMTRRPQ